ncbi:hypothetical protein TrVE_jg1052 [Triparma verrucosa]|uniref:Charged multivesicular body protein 6 n=1 Tax=Triparma verrucosa TaxID=1606542 RepID=A0A9W7EJR1_9STRA|nr:hypothetical protein TrVE_jg1052 [Triparma verrucosa]
MGPSSSKAAKAASSAPLGTVTSQDRAVLDLKNARDRLKRYIKTLETDEARLLNRAKLLNSQGKKRQAILLMKVRKKKLSEAQSVESQLLNVYEMVQTIQWQSEQQTIMSALASGKEALKQLHSEMSVDAVLDLMDEVESEQEQERQINEALTRGVSWATVDDEELEKELQQLQGETAADEKTSEEKTTEERTAQYDVDKIPEAPINMPLAPTGGLDTKQDEKEEIKEQERVAVPA